MPKASRHSPFWGEAGLCEFFVFRDSPEDSVSSSYGTVLLGDGPAVFERLSMPGAFVEERQGSPRLRRRGEGAREGKESRAFPRWDGRADFAPPGDERQAVLLTGRIKTGNIFMGGLWGIHGRAVGGHGVAKGRPCAMLLLLKEKRVSSACLKTGVL